jgi:hypothetical protein
LPDAIRVTDRGAKTTMLRCHEIDQIRPSGTSIMPVGLAGGLGEAGVRDLYRLLDIGKGSWLRLGDPLSPMTLFTHPESAGERCSQDRRDSFGT